MTRQMENKRVEAVVNPIPVLKHNGRNVRGLVTTPVWDRRVVGINTRKVDRTTFALGCGVAGVAGAAFTTIGSTGPTSGSLYIVGAARPYLRTRLV